MTTDTTRMISDEIINPLTRRISENKSFLNSQLQDAISTAFAEKIFPSIQNTLDMQGRGNFIAMDRRSSGLEGNPEVEITQKFWDNCPILSFKLRNLGQTYVRGEFSRIPYKRTKSGQSKNNYKK